MIFFLLNTLYRNQNNQNKGQFARTFISSLPKIPRINPSLTALNSARRTNDHDRPSRASYRAIGVSAKDKGGRGMGEENWSAT